MKLFIWDDVLCNYTSGMIVAMAEDLGHAIKMATEQEDLGDYVASEMAGEPKRVVDIQTTEKPFVDVVWGGG